MICPVTTQVRTGAVAEGERSLAPPPELGTVAHIVRAAPSSRGSRSGCGAPGASGISGPSMTYRRVSIVAVAQTIDYAVPGTLTNLDGVPPAALGPVAADPIEICFPVHGLVIQPADAETLDLPAERFAANQIRPASALVRELLALDPAPVTIPRRPQKRVVGTCRHFAVLSCALLRYRGIASRVRCGFATYFQPGQGLDHRITEYWDDTAARWTRTDSEIIGQSVLRCPEDLTPGQFLQDPERHEPARWPGSPPWTGYVAAGGTPADDRLGPAAPCWPGPEGAAGPVMRAGARLGRCMVSWRRWIAGSWHSSPG